MLEKENTRVESRDSSVLVVERQVKPVLASGSSILSREDLARYYRQIAEHMLPHIKDRPLTAERTGKSAGIFRMIEASNTPEYISTAVVSFDTRENLRVPLAQNARSLDYLVEQGNLAFHGWNSRYDKPALPDRMVLNLNPPDVAYLEETVEAAFLLKELLEETNMCPYVMSTASRGLHIVCPLRRNRSFDQVQNFLREISQKAVAARPDLVTLMTERARQGEKISIDLSLNRHGRTAIVPYSARPMDHGPVAVPLDWDELEASDFHPQRTTISTIAARLKARPNMWENFFRHKRKLMR